MKIFQILSLTACLAVAVQADTLRLKNGRTVDGTYIGGDSRQVKFVGPDGRVQNYALSDVSEIRFGESAHNEAVAAPSPAPRSRTETARASSSSRTVIPAGTVVTVRMIDSIDSDITGVGERFRASLEEPLVVDGREVAPRGADALVEVARVEQSGRIRGKDEVAIELATLTINGREYELNTNYAEVESKGKTAKTAKTAGAGAAVGAIIGAIAGGGKGAAIGAGVGAGAGTVYAATRGEKVRIPSETLLTFTLRQDLAL